MFRAQPEIDNLPDEEVLKRSLAHPELFGVILSRYEEPFIRKALRIMGTPEDAHDVVQDTFTKIYVNASRYKPVAGASFKSWAYRILVNTAYTAYVKRKKDGQFAGRLDPELDEVIKDTKEEGIREQRTLSDYIVSVFSAMPRELARALKLHFIDGLPHQEIAKQEGISVAAVKTRVYRAKRLFKEISGYKE